MRDSAPKSEQRAREHYAGGGMRGDASDVWQTAEVELRRVCREQRAEIERLQARIVELEIQLGQRARVRALMGGRGGV